MTRRVIRATIDDAVPRIYTREQADAIIAGYPEHEREARAKGIPTMGSGRIFPVAQEVISYDGSPRLAAHIKYIGGIDIGWTHPTAAVKCAVDNDTNTFTVVAAHKLAEATPLTHYGTLAPWGKWMPWAWPHDASQTDKQSGKQIAVVYRDLGLNMLHQRACHPDGSVGVEAGLVQMLDAMRTGHFRVAEHLQDWWDEFLLYHRKEGEVVKEFDDLMAATRYAWMMRRFAEAEFVNEPAPGRDTPNTEYGWMR